MRLLALLRLDLLLRDNAHDTDSYCLLHVTHSEHPECRIFLESFNNTRLDRDDIDDGCIVPLDPNNNTFTWSDPEGVLGCTGIRA
jgi:hypothetical protein